MIKAVEVNSATGLLCCRYHNLHVKDAPCLSLRGKEGQKAESEETGKGWREIKRVLWKEALVHVLLREQNTSFICCSPGDTFASSSTLEYENSHLTPRLESPPPFIHPFFIFQFPPPQSSLECSSPPPPRSQNPPTPYPSSSHPYLIPSLQHLVINVSFNCHAHFYAH